MNNCPWSWKKNPYIFSSWRLCKCVEKGSLCLLRSKTDIWQKRSTPYHTENIIPSVKIVVVVPSCCEDAIYKQKLENWSGLMLRWMVQVNTGNPRRKCVPVCQRPESRAKLPLPLLTGVGSIPRIWMSVKAQPWTNCGSWKLMYGNLPTSNMMELKLSGMGRIIGIYSSDRGISRLAAVTTADSFSKYWPWGSGYLCNHKCLDFLLQYKMFLHLHCYTCACCIVIYAVSYADWNNRDWNNRREKDRKERDKKGKDKRESDRLLPVSVKFVISFPLFRVCSISSGSSSTSLPPQPLFLLIPCWYWHIHFDHNI